MKSPPPLCSVLTPGAASGIAVVILDGEGAGEILARTFRRPSGKGLPPVDRAAFGTIDRKGESLDEVLVIRVGPGRSERFEICCHGGSAAAKAVTVFFSSCGARPVPWARLVETGTLDEDLTTALLSAEGGEQALCLAHLSSGPLEEVLREAGGALERRLDRGKKESALTGRLEDLLLTQSYGRFLKTPPLIVISGAPNAGKSTLFNAILGESRALTSPFPGTTRDPVEARFLLHGFPTRLVDTAGARADEGDPLTRRGVAAAADLLREADIEIHLAPWPGGDDSERTPRRPGPGPMRSLLPVLSKCDLAAGKNGSPVAVAEGGIVGPLPIAALQGAGIPALLDRAAEDLRLDLLADRTSPFIWTRCQVDLVEASLEALNSGRNRRPALAGLRRYLGRRLSGDPSV
jgi:tRNA modification GTPase